LHFAVDSKWSDQEVRREAAQYALSAMTEREPVEAWIVDDTGFLKQGKHSVGVQRQYTGSAGKTTNCQIGVSLSIATRTEHLPIDFELYLPESWANEAARRHEARIPPGVSFKSKPKLALQMIRRALKQGVPKGLVLGDSAYEGVEPKQGSRRPDPTSCARPFAEEPSRTLSALERDGPPTRPGRRGPGALGGRQPAACVG
jgi:SRSO17 transposase